MTKSRSIHFALLVFLCLFLLAGFWGCAPKPIIKPTVPTVKLPPEEPRVEPKIDLMAILMAEAENLAAQENFQDALLIYNQALNQAGQIEGVDGEYSRQQVLSDIEDLLSITPVFDIDEFSAIKNLTIPPALFQYWLGYGYAAQEDYAVAERVLTAFLQAYPNHHRAEDARVLIRTIRDLTFDKKVLGCLLPLSGKYKIYGQNALRGIQLAVHDLSQTLGLELKVIVKDTQADPYRAALCVEELARENVFAIAGPLLVPGAAGKKAEELGIPMIAMTQKTEFPAQGEYLFSNFITPEMQVEALASYIFMELGLKKVAILYPDERYGKRYMESFWDVVDKFHGQVVGVEAYDGKKTDFTHPLQKLTGEYYPVPEFLKPPEPEDNEDNLDESDSDEPDSIDEPDQKRSSRSSAVANEDRIEIDFQALFIPDALSRVNLILPQLAFYDARGMVLLGTNLWHQKSLLTQAKGYNKNAVICDGYFGKSENPITARFDRDFRAVYQTGPGFLEAVSYDTASLLFTGVMDPEVDSKASLKNLLQGKLTFNGVTGTTVFDETGTPHKELFLITVQKGRFQEIHR